MSNLKPQTFGVIDSDAYADDRPLHTGLDYRVRQQLKFLGAEGHGAAASRKKMSEENAKLASVHQTALCYTILTPHTHLTRLHFDLIVKGAVGSGGNFGDDFEFWPFVTTTSGLRRIEGGRQTPAEITGATTSTDVDSTKIPLHMELDVSNAGRTWFNSGPHVIGVAMQRINYKTGGNSVELIGSANTGVLSTEPSEGSQNVAIYDEQDSSIYADIVKWEPGGFPVESDPNNFAFTRIQSRDRFENNGESLIWTDIGWVRLYSWQVHADYDDGFVDGGDPYPLGMIRPNVEPRMDRGGGAAYRTSNQVWTQPRLSNIDFEQEDRPTHFDRFPKWRYVDSDETTPTETIEHPVVFESDGVGEPLQVDVHVLVFGVLRDSYPDNTMDYNAGGEPVQQADNVDVDYTGYIVSDDGTVEFSDTDTQTTRFYPVDFDGSNTFLQQAYLSIENDTSGGDRGFTDKEGLLYLREGYGNDLLYAEIHTVRLVTNDLPGDMDHVHQVDLTLDVSPSGRTDLRLYALTSSVEQVVV